MNEIIYQTVIPLNPRTKKNSQQIIYRNNKPRIIQSDKYIQYEKDAGWFLKKPVRPIDYPVNIECRFYRKNAIRCDLTNLLENIPNK